MVMSGQICTPVIDPYTEDLHTAKLRQASRNGDTQTVSKTTEVETPSKQTDDTTKLMGKIYSTTSCTDQTFIK